MAYHNSRRFIVAGYPKPIHRWAAEAKGDGEANNPTSSKRMVAKYPGKCIDTGKTINVGDTIDYIRGTGAVLISSTASAPSTGYVSDVFRTSGGTFYRNKQGRCEDAPCCGCCTI